MSRTAEVKTLLCASNEIPYGARGYTRIQQVSGNCAETNNTFKVDGPVREELLERYALLKQRVDDPKDYPQTRVERAL